MERPAKIVIVDASVAVKWFVEEEFTKQALQVLEDYEARMIDVRSTQVMPFEVLNALRYNPELGRSEIEKAGDALSRFKIALYPILGELKAACLRMAFDHGITVYDASYLSLGELLRCDVYTSDTKMIEKSQGEGALHHIRDYVRLSK